MKRLLAVVLAACFLAACGVPMDDEPRVISDDQVQYNLLEPATTTTVPDGADQTINVFLLGGSDRLVAVERSITDPRNVGAALASLIQGPTGAEQASGLRSAINEQTAVLGAEVTSGVANVDVSADFSGVGAQEQIYALAEVVFTATGIEGVASVQVRLDGTAVEVPRGDGTLTSAPLTRADYESLAPSA